MIHARFHPMAISLSVRYFVFGQIERLWKITLNRNTSIHLTPSANKSAHVCSKQSCMCVRVCNCIDRIRKSALVWLWILEVNGLKRNPIKHLSIFAYIRIVSRARKVEYSDKSMIVDGEISSLAHIDYSNSMPRRCELNCSGKKSFAANERREYCRNSNENCANEFGDQANWQNSHFIVHDSDYDDGDRFGRQFRMKTCVLFMSSCVNLARVHMILLHRSMCVPLRLFYAMPVEAPSVAPRHSHTNTMKPIKNILVIYFVF